ncbi:uncharacterized protein LY89DRAFT_781340 [Mollisia scopiformis]|uniref:Uncharacterized protein n=1 Tax=Mollisia scopiformis TaxID=149040 RepID=A0A194XDK7_MOLSC|nr:uncharacterized protein LY89DRAFT_781340 [Mollisia scopiformis]KUJ18265.1 hypothetical protein LY89DRAFT_781340 [Mollisia scopiformis]
MADTPPVASSEASTPPSSAAEQARIRKERREAKIRAGGSARLNRITGLGGGVQRDAPPQPTVSSHADPDEVDISQHFYEPQRTSRANVNSSPSLASMPQGMNDDALRQMMLGFDPAAAPGAGPGGMPQTPFASFMGGMDGMGDGPAADDPIMKMMQQMMGGMNGDGPQGMPSFPGMPPMPGQPVAATADPYAYLWRIVHAVFALGLGLYIAFTTTFTGTKIDRERSALGYSSADDGVMKPALVHFFWVFATVEVLLQSSRFFLEKGRVQQGGILGMITSFLPEPYKGYLTWFSRYSRIWTTVSGDAMVCVFVLGVCAWLRGN